ncbi:hypothetical protein HDV00_009267 [Rhizophlyctis rosea]|nr:hypothetical protein HDV00_009267 [Rhizophlyctis rosea]
MQRFVSSLALAAISASIATAQLAPLESNGIYFGAWLDTRPGYDSPVQFNRRVGQLSSFFQLAEDFPLDFNKPPPVELIDYTQTDALLYLTIYPSKAVVTNQTSNQVLDQFKDTDVQELVKQLLGYVANGRKVLVRLFPEMNGSWNPWGQRPVAYKREWMRIVTAVRTALPNDKKDWIAFIWAPSAGITRGGGYPFPAGGNTPFTPHTGSFTARTAANTTEFTALDTNKDGVFDDKDDPYSPYYPGNQYVDWVGMSIYYYGNSYPWEKNELPVATSFVEQLTGTPPAATASSVNFYQVYSVNNNKPMIIAEANAAFHEYLIAGRKSIDPGPGNLAIKQAFWKQFLTSPAFLSAHPKIKAICLFEFQKDEETTYRDFEITNDTSILAAFKKDFEVQDVYTRYIFANCSTGAKGGALVNCTGSAGASNTTTTVNDSGKTGPVDGKASGATVTSRVSAGVLLLLSAGLWAFL